MSASNGNNSRQAILIGIIITVVGGVILAIIVGEGRFKPSEQLAPMTIAPQDVVTAGVKAFTDTNAQLGWATQSTKVVSSKQYQASPADKLNGIDDKWCLIIEFVVGVPGGYKDGQVFVSVKKIQGNWQAYADYPWFPPPVSLSGNITVIQFRVDQCRPTWRAVE